MNISLSIGLTNPHILPPEPDEPPPEQPGQLRFSDPTNSGLAVALMLV